MALKAEVKSTELMIGNWVIDHTGEYHQVTPLGIVHQSQYNIAGAEGYKGIPLDESVLLKCTKLVQKKTNKTLYFDINRHLVLVKCENWLIVSVKEKYGKFLDLNLPRIYFLHELQNWYTLFTGGQHLTFKP